MRDKDEVVFFCLKAIVSFFLGFFPNFFSQSEKVEKADFFAWVDDSTGKKVIFGASIQRHF